MFLNLTILFDTIPTEPKEFRLGAVASPFTPVQKHRQSGVMVFFAPLLSLTPPSGSRGYTTRNT